MSRFGLGFIVPAAVGGGGPVVHTWNDADRSPNIALTGSDLIATASGASNYKNVRTTSKIAAAFIGEVVVEFTGIVAGNSESGFGVATATAALDGVSAWGGVDGNSILIYLGSGNIYTNGATGTSIGPLGTTSRHLAIQFLAAGIKFRTATDGTTWGAQTAEIIRPSGDLYIMGGLYVSADSQTINPAPTFTLVGANTWASQAT